MGMNLHMSNFKVKHMYTAPDIADSWHILIDLFHHILGGVVLTLGLLSVDDSDSLQSPESVGSTHMLHTCKIHSTKTGNWPVVSPQTKYPLHWNSF